MRDRARSAADARLLRATGYSTVTAGLAGNENGVTREEPQYAHSFSTAGRPRLGRRHTQSEGSQAAWGPCRELAFCRARQDTPRNIGWSAAPRSSKPGDPSRADRLWFATRRTGNSQG